MTNERLNYVDFIHKLINDITHYSYQLNKIKFNIPTYNLRSEQTL